MTDKSFRHWYSLDMLELTREQVLLALDMSMHKATEISVSIARMQNLFDEPRPTNSIIVASEQSNQKDYKGQFADLNDATVEQISFMAALVQYCQKNFTDESARDISELLMKTETVIEAWDLTHAALVELYDKLDKEY